MEQIAGFGELTYDVNESLHITVGGRYYDFDEVRTVTQVGLFGNGVVDQLDKTASTGFTPRFIASYDVNEEVTVNAQASRGFRLGGVNDPLNTALCDPADLEIFGGFQDYKDEKIWNFETGVKITRPGLRFNAAAFYTDISNLQVTLDAGSCSSRISFNVPEAHTAGIEAELTLEPIPGLNLNLSGSFIESEFDSTVIDSTGSILGGVEKGNRLPSVPKFQVSASASYDFPIEQIGEGMMGFVSASIQHVGTRFTQPSDQVAGAGDFVSGLPFGGASGNDVTSLDLKLDAYQIVNINAGLYRGQWEVKAFINNLFDENADLSFDRERGGRARLGFRTNQPRTIGLTLRKDF